MKNKLEDLNNHLFAQFERLGDEDVKGDALKEEIERAQAITQIACQIISNGKLVLEAVKVKSDYCGGKAEKEMPALLRDSLLSHSEL